MPIHPLICFISQHFNLHLLEFSVNVIQDEPIFFLPSFSKHNCFAIAVVEHISSYSFLLLNNMSLCMDVIQLFTHQL